MPPIPCTTQEEGQLFKSKAAGTEIATDEQEEKADYAAAFPDTAAAFADLAAMTGGADLMDDDAPAEQQGGGAQAGMATDGEANSSGARALARGRLLQDIVTTHEWCVCARQGRCRRLLCCVS